jgi:hypothetical protein
MAFVNEHLRRSRSEFMAMVNAKPMSATVCFQLLLVRKSSTIIEGREPEKWQQ